MYSKLMSRLPGPLAAVALVGLGLMAPQTADANPAWVFPQNHTDLEWSTIETEHFLVHYPVSKESAEEGNDHYLTGEWAAYKYARVAEEIWQPMCAEFNYFLKEKINVVVLNQTDNLEGFTVPAWDWIVMSANPGGTFYRGRGRMEWFSDVFVHEFAHVVSLKANAAHSEGAFATFNSALYENGINRGKLNQISVGADLPIGDGDSVFWTEGGAEYWSDNTNYNWWTPSRDQNIRMTVLDDRLLKYSEWHTRSAKSQSGWNDHERYYQQGYSFGLYLRERFGDDTYAKFALEYSKRWRPQWESVIEEVLGIDAETLYDDWKEYVTERYNTQYDRIKERGEVHGSEMLSGPREWHYTDPDGRESYANQERSGWFGNKTNGELERDRESTGRYQWEPRVSSDGDYIGWVNRAVLQVSRANDDQVWAFTGVSPTDPIRLEEAKSLSFRIPYATFDHGWDFVPGKDAVVLTGSEERRPRGWLGSEMNLWMETDGYNWKQLYYFEYPEVVEERHGNRTVATRSPTKGKASRVDYNGEWRSIPNTLRGTDPSVCSDGEQVAYFEYTDGTMNLVTIKTDGSDKTHLTEFDDGTWFQVVDWSPDCSQVVFGLFRNYNQNLYIANADGSDIKPIMVDSWEELDAHWSAVDGRIYFAADPDGVFNIFSYDPKSEDFLQLTNVVGGATSPQITPDGNLVYSYYTSFGWKIYGLAADRFMNEPANHLFKTEYDMDAVNEGLAYREDMSEYIPLTTEYRPGKSLVAPLFIPIYQMRSDSLTNWGVSAGFQTQVMDAVQFNQLFAYALLGEDTIFQAGYTYSGWYPTVAAFAGHYRGKSDIGYLLDADDDPNSTEDQRIFDIRQLFNYTFGGASADYQWNNNFATSLELSGLQYMVDSPTDHTYDPYMHWVDGIARARWSGLELVYGHTYTDITYEVLNGVTVDDGEMLDNYHFNQFEANVRKAFPIPAFGTKFGRYLQGRGHALQFNSQMGWIDRNVAGNNEFRAGGRHPSNQGFNSLQTNSQFAGFPAWSLGGETMMIANAAYRLPLTRHDWHVLTGPLFTYGAELHLGGTIGNIWSFRPPDDPSLYYAGLYGNRVAYDPADIKREIPFIDEAYKNGNKVLTDLSAELRIRSVLYHGIGWDSFIRVAYGFQDIAGNGDVNGDDIIDSNTNALAVELSNEIEPAGFRFYLGLGTGW